MKLNCPIRGILNAEEIAKDGTTPTEEKVRIDLVKELINKGYPKNSIDFEYQYDGGSAGKVIRRVDLVVYFFNKDVKVVAEVKRDSNVLYLAKKNQLETAMKLTESLYGIYYDGTNNFFIHNKYYKKEESFKNFPNYKDLKIEVLEKELRKTQDNNRYLEKELSQKQNNYEYLENKYNILKSNLENNLLVLDNKSNDNNKNIIQEYKLENNKFIKNSTKTKNNILKDKKISDYQQLIKNNFINLRDFIFIKDRIFRFNKDGNIINLYGELVGSPHRVCYDLNNKKSINAWDTITKINKTVKLSVLRQDKKWKFIDLIENDAINLKTLIIIKDRIFRFNKNGNLVDLKGNLQGSPNSVCRKIYKYKTINAWDYIKVIITTTKLSAIKKDYYNN